MLLHRLTNVLKISASYVISRMTRRVFHWGKPIAVSIEPTNSCNLHCPECPSGSGELTRPRGVMSMETFRSVINQLSPQLTYLTLYFQGEPFMNSMFHEMTKVARSKNVFVSSSTNGHFLTPEVARKTVESGLNRLIVSLDGTDQTAYESYRIGGSYEKVIKGITNLVEARKVLHSNHPQVILQFLVLSTNEHQISAVKRLGKSLGVDKVELKSAQFYDYRYGNPLIPKNRKYTRYERVQNLGSAASPEKSARLDPHQPETKTPRFRDDEFRLRNSLPRHCFRMWSGCVFTWDGKVVPCCFDKDAKNPLGDLNEQTFTGIWNSKRYDQFRQQILDHRENIEICRNCSEGMGVTKIW